MKYKNNKEHPIDNLFAQKLGNLEGSPSENAWQALEKGLSQKPRKKNKAILWLPYAAAAAIALLVVSVWLLRQQTTGILNNTGLANNNQVESRQEQNNSTSIQHTPAAKTENLQLPDTKIIQEQIAMQEGVDRKEEQEKADTKKDEGKNNQLTGNPTEKKITRQPVIKEVERERTIKPAITPLENTVAQIEREELPSVITPASLTKEESTTIVVTVKLDEETGDSGEEDILEEGTEQVQKQSRAGKFFSTLKKIKKGDFDELGIRPETIVAYVKDRASNNQSSEKQ